MPYKNLLLVEGQNDQHVIQHVLKKWNISSRLFEETDAVENVIAIKSLDGYPRLRKRLPRELRLASEIERVGVVADADDDPAARWQSLRDRLIEAGGKSVPNALQEEGWVGSVRLQTGDVAAGAWLMPDNDDSGALEEFAVELIDSQGALWSYADNCLENLPERRFADKDETKALVHTWLAWQEEPRQPMGRAVDKGYFDAKALLAERFVRWVRRLFDV